jgi:ABC-type sugar transport system permease subunit
VNDRSTVWDGYGYVLPLLLIEALFVVVPLGISIQYSLHRADYFQLGEWRGLENYAQLLRSATILKSLVVTGIFSISALIFTFVIGFALALFLERDSRTHIFIRSVVLIPYTISMLVGSLLLKWIFASDAGLLPMALGPLGLNNATILADPEGAMVALVFNAIWRDSAFAMILLMAGLKGIDPQLYAAARVDGASALYRFRRLTLPQMRVPILITLIRLFIHFVNVLTYPLILTGGGPDGATQTLGLTLYRIGFSDFHAGQANALALMVFAFNLLLIAVLISVFRERRVPA